MRRILIFFSALAVAATVWAETTGDWTDYRAESFSTINAGEMSITIASPAELALFAYNVNHEMKDGNQVPFKYYNVTLGTDLDLSGHYWIPIGTNNTEKTFTGTFDGAGHTISSLEVKVEGSVTGNVAGLFGKIDEKGRVRDVRINSVSVQLNSATASCWVGSIAGINVGTIVGCANHAVVRGNFASANVGGIAGQNNGTIQNCYNLGRVYSSNGSMNHLGGIAGDNAGTIQNCFVKAEITNSSSDAGTSVKGPIVANNTGTYTRCFYANGTTGDMDYILSLGNATDNSAAITAAGGQTKNVLLSGRTIFADGAWNTICLPFDISAGATGYSPIAGAEVMELSSTSFSRGRLTMNFSPVTDIKAGKPYIIKWADTAIEDLSNLLFLGATISNSDVSTVTTTYVDFVGSYSPVALAADDRTSLFLGTGNTLYYPSEAMTINAFRAYFQLKGDLKAGDPGSNGIKAFALNLNGEETAVATTFASQERVAEGWYDLSGRRVADASFTTPSTSLPRGIYIHHGRKIVVK